MTNDRPPIKGKKARLLELLKELSYENRPVTLTSGKTSSYYVDGKQTTLHSEGSYLTGSLVLETIQDSGRPIKGVGGLTMGADPIASAVSVLSWAAGTPISAFYIRKEPKGHGKNLWIEGNKNLAPRDQVAIVEDVVTTGGSLWKAVERTLDHGLEVAMVITLLDRLEGGREMLQAKGFPLTSLFTINDLRS
ncbi:MAG: orotate phosphoribosyltransferase [Deltaproteobacteria bacterium]|nr:orotate phosphoribosyltransferase [Candidatus Anaeroferrophillus wilburensis]MBN2889449.1 orotate phosphoribosyltransferase [Deltaproteobacteria bacterium]